MAIWNVLRTCGIFYGHVGYFTGIWDILRTFGIFYGHLEYFTDIWYILGSFGMYNRLFILFRFWYHVPRKVWQPLLEHCSSGIPGSLLTNGPTPILANQTLTSWRHNLT
jgi:hypothetical protein